MSRKRIVNILLKEWQFLFTDINNTLLVTLLPLLIIGQLVLYIWLAVNFASESALNISIFLNKYIDLSECPSKSAKSHSRSSPTIRGRAVSGAFA